ncbi:hypothetical protein [Sulfitobacter sp.]|uniref:hypothetical protein n=1 Tax=Sulfitobacter sp. TaxID=1903071 RepID=UPI003EF882EF
MTYADVAFIACFVIIAWMVVDYRRGKTAIGKLRLTKEGTPQKYWYAIVLYVNMALWLFWLSGSVGQSETLIPLCDTAEGPCTLVLEIDPQ